MRGRGILNIDFCCPSGLNIEYTFLSGHVIVSGCADGVVAISSPMSGLVVRVISDHQGAPITDIQSSSNPLMVCMSFEYIALGLIPLFHMETECS